MLLRMLVMVIFVFSGSSAFGDTSKAGYFFAPTLLYYELDYEENNSNREEERTDLDLTAGYSFGSFMLGAKYYRSKIDFGDYRTEGDAIGAALGFEHKGFKLIGSYYFLGVDKKISNPEVEYSDGTGTAVEAMYICDLGSWGLGPKILYKSFTYRDKEVNGSAVSDFDGRNETEILPFVALFFKI